MSDQFGNSGGRPSDEALSREARELLDEYNSRASIKAGGRTIMEPGKALANVHHLMERIDIDPLQGFAPEEAITAEEMESLAQMSLLDLVVAESAWSARRVLAPRWPQERVEGPIADEARLSMFMDGPGFALSDEDEARGKAVLNRALASPSRVDEHVELVGLSAAGLAQTWFAMLAWYSVKCLALNAAE